ncbi:hypothetical protein GCM10012275_61650 [Longimycelium tulufanense]|uniref:Uncharacterized protein n=1 Tax=Longimycelium tulufanense TaxID=907463 RepID=A0A8J3CIL3_9PSEU|nr:hypothetical protein [Longimycelium tulufanense]GGM82813.1 hypothetical protein GCM10012275_61650 [Longimycelium tulufanense]
MIRPRVLPRIRDRMVWLLTDPDSDLRRVVDDDEGLLLDTVARHLTTGALYWVTADMAALATAAGRSLDTVRWCSQDRPAPTGLMVMDGGVGWMPYQGVDYPIDALSWGPGPDGLLLCLWLARRRLDDRLAPHGAAVVPERTAALLPVLGHTMPVHSEDHPVTALPDHLRTLATTLAAAWHLMDQPTLSEQRPAPIDRGLRRVYTRQQRPEPAVTLIDLRSRYRPTDPDQQPDLHPSRYHHRWVVRGHWRWQAHGPDHTLRKRIYITDHLKGPHGAPLLRHERVNVWRR